MSRVMNLGTKNLEVEKWVSKWGYAYQNLRNDLLEIFDYMERISKPIPEGMALSDRPDPETTSKALKTCIDATTHVKEELSSARSMNEKIAAALVTRFLCDANHFNDDYTAEVLGTLPFHED